MIDVFVLSKLLSPFLPYLLKLGDKAAEESAKKLGVDGWEKAKAIWVKLQPKVETKPSAKEAVENVVQEPEDEDALASLRLQLKKLLKEDPNLDSAIAYLLTEAEEVGVTTISVTGSGAAATSDGVAAGEGGAAVKGDVKGGIHIGNSPKKSS